MNKDTIKSALCDVIEEIQTISGLDCPALSGGTKPARDVKDFISEVWPIATAMLGAKLGVDIPKDENLFCDKDKSLCSIDQCVQKVLKIAEKNTKKVKDDD